MSQMATSKPSPRAWATACAQLVTGVGARGLLRQALAVSEARTEGS